jgi:HAD superfamily hydrolase (TIGR01490 family)
LSPAVAAYFDVDGTLTRTTTLDPLLWYQRAHLPPWQFRIWAAGLWLKAPYYWALDKRSRSRFNVVFFRRYAGLPMDELHRWHRATFAENLQRRIFPAALECLRDHQRQGQRVVLLTGAAEFVVQPLADFVKTDRLIALRLGERDGVCTGELCGPPIADEQKATLLRNDAQEHGIDLGRSFGYGDSFGDAPMLRSVGNPVAVQPGRRLGRLAREQGWRVVAWRLGGE